MRRMSKIALVASAGAVGCAANVSARSECKPIRDRCDGDVIQTCQLDVELLQRGQHVYVWTDMLTCEDDEVAGPYACFEERTRDGRVQATCELESDIAQWSSRDSGVGE